jgi:trk system potassium uptake protein TrkA
LASGLSLAGIETLLIVEDRDAAEHLAAKLPKTTVICGQGSDVDLFKQERLGLYDIYFAVTADDESNLISGLLAKSLGVERVACLVQRQDFGTIYPKVGIDVVLSSRQVAADKILSFTQANLVENIVHLSDGRAEVYELTAQPKSAVVKRIVSELKLPDGVFLGGVLRGDAVKMPNGQFQIEPHDRVVVLSLTEQRGAVEKLFRKQLF